MPTSTMSYNDMRNAFSQCFRAFIDALRAAFVRYPVSCWEIEEVDRRLRELNDPEFSRHLVDANPRLFH